MKGTDMTMKFFLIASIFGTSSIYGMHITTEATPLPDYKRKMIETWLSHIRMQQCDYLSKQPDIQNCQQKLFAPPMSDTQKEKIYKCNRLFCSLRCKSFEEYRHHCFARHGVFTCRCGTQYQSEICYRVHVLSCKTMIF